MYEEVENPVVIDSLWTHGQSTYAWADDPVMQDFDLSIDFSRVPTEVFAELDERLFDIRMKRDNIILNNEDDLDVEDLNAEDSIYVEGSVLRIYGEILEADYDEFLEIIDSLGLEYKEN